MRWFILCSVMLIGCQTAYNDPVVVEQNRITLSGVGESVGTLPDGRKVVRYEIEMGSNLNHWIYVAENTITVNHTETHGKTTANHTEVIIDGKVFVPKSELKAEFEN